VFVALPKRVVELLNFVLVTIGAYVMSEDISKATSIRNVEQKHISACIVRTRLGEAKLLSGPFL
jgi:hypothetical protein